MLLVVEFGDTLFSYFTSDDLTHIGYVARFFAGEPELFFKTFATVWTQDTSSETFYRPITELSFALDYLFSQAAPIGYHVSNLIYTAVAAVALLFISESLCRRFEIENGFLIGCCAAILFAINPLHTEVTSWIVGRVDGLSTMFYLLSFAFFLKREEALDTDARKASAAYAISLITFTLGFFSKEMAGTLPFVIGLYALFTASDERFPARVKRAFFTALPYLSVLVALLIVRFFATGAFIGGYSGAASQSIGFTALFERFVNLWKIAFPFNEELMPKGGSVEGLFRLFFLFFGIFMLSRSAYDNFLPVQLRCIGFLVSWLIVQMAPLYQVFMLNPSLSGNRLFYLSTAVISIILAILLVPGQFRHSPKLARYAKVYAICVFCLLSALFVSVGKKNNECWVTAGKHTYEIRNQIEDAVHSLPAEKKLLVAFLPHQISGGHMFYSYYLLRSLLRPPLTKPEIASRVFVLEPRLFTNDRILPSEILREKLAKPAEYQVVYWDEKVLELKPFEMVSHFGKQLPQIQIQPDSKTGKVLLTADQPVQTADVRFLDIDIEILKQDTKRKSLELKVDDKEGLLLHTADWMVAEYDPSKRFQTVSYPVDELTSWLFMKEAQKFSIYISVKPEVRILGARFSDGNAEIVNVSADKETLRECADGVYRPEKFPAFVSFDASNILAAKSVICEISPPHSMFQLEHSTYRDRTCSEKVLKTIVFPATAGSIKLEQSFFAKKAIYQVRVFGLNENGQVVGTSSNPVYIGIDDRPKDQPL